MRHAVARLGLWGALVAAATVIGSFVPAAALADGSWPPPTSASGSVYARPDHGGAAPGLPQPVEPYRLEAAPPGSLPPDPRSLMPLPGAESPVSRPPASWSPDGGASAPTGHEMPPAGPSSASGGRFGRSAPATTSGGEAWTQDLQPSRGPSSAASDPIGQPGDYRRVAMTGSPIPAELPPGDHPGAEGKTPLPRRGDSGSDDAPGTGLKSPWVSATTTMASLAVVLALFFAVVFMTRKGKPAAGNGRMPGEILEPLGTIPAGPRAEYRLVRFADRVLLLHAQGATVVTLSEVTDLDTVEHLVTLCRQNQKDALAGGLRRLLAGGNAAPSNSRRVRAVA